MFFISTPTEHIYRTRPKQPIECNSCDKEKLKNKIKIESEIVYDIICLCQRKDNENTEDLNKDMLNTLTHEVPNVNEQT